MSFDKLEEIEEDGPGLNVPRKSTKVNLNANIINNTSNNQNGGRLIDSDLRSPGTTDQHFQNSVATPNNGSTKPPMVTTENNLFGGGEQ